MKTRTQIPKKTNIKANHEFVCSNRSKYLYCAVRFHRNEWSFKFMRFVIDMLKVCFRNDGFKYLRALSCSYILYILYRNTVMYFRMMTMMMMCISTLEHTKLLLNVKQIYILKNESVKELLHYKHRTYFELANCNNKLLAFVYILIHIYAIEIFVFCLFVFPFCFLFSSSFGNYTHFNQHIFIIFAAFHSFIFFCYMYGIFICESI